jgi:amino-acid N-acetyltransferase
MTRAASADLRPAAIEDVPGIVAVLQGPAEGGLILPRPASDVESHLANFVVAVLPNARLVGCVALRDFGKGLFEIRSLAVDPRQQGMGLGSRLVRAAVTRARDLSAANVFALTYRPRLFERQQFVRVPKEMFPQKVWDDCAKCPKRDYCDEVALLLRIQPQDSPDAVA